MSYPPIENHGIIGDLRTAALVRNDGAIDFMCFPYFDSPTVFASLLDARKGGFFQIEPTPGDFHRHQSYRPNTNILDTTFRSAHATAIVSDFMTVEQSGDRHCLVRRVETVRGEVPFQAVCAPKFGYANVGHKVEKKPKGILFIPNRAAMPPMLLRASVPLGHANGEARARFLLRAGQSAWFILEEFSSGLESADAHWVSHALEKTRRYWQSWVARSTYRGRWQEMVNRSALTLALLMSKRDGSIVAAPTFGLPEWPGAGRNWDYRFTWVRDASFALDAFLQLGYTNEARAIMGWLDKRCRQSIPEKPLQVVYRLNGSRKLSERTLDNLEGYEGSRPVRIGNAACGQLQLDIYGEFIDAVYLFDQQHKAISPEFWRHIHRLVEWVCQNWNRVDDSIWEIRNGALPFLYSRAMCWVTVDRAIKLARRRSFPAPLDRWNSVRERIHRTFYSTFWNPKLKSFVQYHGAKIVDASMLLLPGVNFIASSDSRWRLTLKAIEKHLVTDCFVYRYLPFTSYTGRTASEGTFSACSFWYVEALADANKLVKARSIFEKFLGHANELGLYAEQLGPQGEHLGNFPQALSHISLIRAACNLNERLA
jgi:GH15 family glucan-1,4-alpha-glucosidase